MKHEIDTPLRKARKSKELTLVDLAHRTGTNFGNLSRIERGLTKATPKIAEKLAAIFAGEITEMHILYPERFSDSKPIATSDA